jgi:hypothetical protein
LETRTAFGSWSTEVMVSNLNFMLADDG